MLVGSMVPTGILFPGINLSPQIQHLPSTWQVPALLLCALVCGPRSGFIASVAYLSVGLFQLPVFHGGGGLGYLQTPAFGYLAGFMPAAWLSGRLARQPGMNNLPLLTLSALAGLVLLQICGILYLLIGSVLTYWPAEELSGMLFSYTFAPLPTQLAICPAIGILALALRRLLFIE